MLPQTPALSLNEVSAALATLTGQARPFQANLRPSVTREPQLVNVQHEDDSDLVFFTLVYESGHRRFVRDFELRHEAEDAFFHVVLRLSRAVLEVRGDTRVTSRAINGWITDFAAALGREPRRLRLSFRDVQDLRTHLNAQMDRHDARHEDEDDGYERHVVTANAKFPDLTGSPRFSADFAGTDPVQSDLVFTYVDASQVSHAARIRISPRTGTIRFVNHASNDVMEYVYDTFRDVRATRVHAAGS